MFFLMGSLSPGSSVTHVFHDGFSLTRFISVPGVVKAGLSRGVVAKGRALLKPLNLDQQRAVLRCCMGEDYTLVQGFPGTGGWEGVGALSYRGCVFGYLSLMSCDWR